MDQGQASVTAALTATLRAVHQVLDDEPKVFLDPVVVGLIPETAPAQLAERRAGFGAPMLRILRSAVVLRSRFAEDELARVVERGIRQYVILGAGLDTFAFRQPPFAQRLQIFEVDHPATQAWKREQLAAAGLVEPANLHWAPIDFEHQGLTDGLRAAGFTSDQPAFFSWLGVTQYLTLPAIDATLQTVAALPRPSTLVLTFMLPDRDLAGEELAAVRSISESAASAGEPWRTRFRPEEIAARLRSLGFREVVHLSPEEANVRYFGPRSDGLRAPHAAQCISATT